MDRIARDALDRALDRDEDLVLHYQPIHDARSGAVLAAEALLRQRRSDGEIREASIIHRAAEKSGAGELEAFDSLLVARAATEAARWQAWAPVRLNVNLSPREFDEGGLPDRIGALLASSGIDPGQVSLEITETSYISEPEETMKVLAAVREQGPQLWLDDFGTGHSSLVHLRHFPLDGLKISGDFVAPLPGDARCRAIVRRVIELGHDLGLSITAEEVERRDQLDFLLEAGCDSVQGFLFHRAMSGAELERLVRETRRPS